jgi:hypothetical protein
MENDFQLHVNIRKAAYDEVSLKEQKTFFSWWYFGIKKLKMHSYIVRMWKRLKTQSTRLRLFWDEKKMKICYNQPKKKEVKFHFKN